MIRLMFLLPIILCLVWFLFLKSHGLSIKQGKQGFVNILIFSGFVLSFFGAMLLIT